jgi:hypothetical protein
METGSDAASPTRTFSTILAALLSALVGRSGTSASLPPVVSERVASQWAEASEAGSEELQLPALSNSVGEGYDSLAHSCHLQSPSTQEFGSVMHAQVHVSTGDSGVVHSCVVYPVSWRRDRWRPRTAAREDSRPTQGLLCQLRLPQESELIR